MSFRVFSGEWAHETNTFCKVKTTLESFKRSHFDVGEEKIRSTKRGTKTGFGAVYEAVDKFDWDLCANVATVANPSGTLTKECFDTICDKFLEPLTLKVDDQPPLPVDGVILMLHGAMVSEEFEDSEGEILARVVSLEI